MKLQFRNLTKSFGDHIVLNNITQTFTAPGQITSIIGASGAGKSTLLNLLFGIDQDFTGEYLIDGRDARKYSDREWDYLRGQKMQIVYQDFKLLENMTVRENLYFAHKNGPEFTGRAAQLTHLLGIEAILDSKVKLISGGQKQRVAIARALFNEPEVLLMDEPTGNLDAANTTEMMQYLSEIKQSGISIVIITHDSRILPFSDNIYRLTSGSLVEEKVAHNSAKAATQVKSRKVQKAGFGLLSKYTLLDLKNNIKNLSYSSVPLMLILAVFMLLITGFKQASLDSFTDLFKGLADNVIYIDSQTLKQSEQAKLNKQKIATSTDGKRVAFSQADLARVSETPHVQKVVNFEYSSSLMDFQENELKESITRDDLPASIKELKSYASAPDELVFQFASMMLPAKDVNLYNPERIRLATGKFPTKQNEVLVPDFYLLLHKKQITQGRNINLPIRTSKGKFSKQEYRISGTYETNYRDSLVPTANLGGYNGYYIYLAYRDLTDLKAATSKETYDSFVEDLTQNKQTQEYSQKIIASYADFVKSVGTGKTGMLIVTDSSNDVPTVSKQLNKLFPKYQQKSRYALTHGEFAASYNKLLTMLIVGVLILAALLTLIFVFLNRQLIGARRKELAILYSLGYSKTDVVKIIAGGIIIQFVGIYLGATLIVYVLKTFLLDRFSYGAMFTSMYSFSNQIVIVIIMLIAIIISVLWGVSSVKKKKLIESLR